MVFFIGNTATMKLCINMSPFWNISQCSSFKANRNGVIFDLHFPGYKHEAGSKQNSARCLVREGILFMLL